MLFIYVTRYERDDGSDVTLLVVVPAVDVIVVVVVVVVPAW